MVSGVSAKSVVFLCLTMILPRFVRTLTRPVSTSVFPFPFKPEGITRIEAVGKESLSNTYSTIVVGGGHAGCEAATAAVRACGVGGRVLLLTQRLDTIGELSCNPSIGGVGKGHLVREIDALDGVMGRAADRGCCHFRMLNERKGPAVRGPRGQMDRDKYKQAVQELLSEVENLDVYPGSVEELVLEKGIVDGAGFEAGVLTGDSDSQTDINKLGSDSTNLYSQRMATCTGVKLGDGTVVNGCNVVITTGTFLGGTLMCGKERYGGGRHLRDSEEVEPPSNGLSLQFAALGLDLGRLKTGTPARVDGKTVDWDVLERQDSDGIHSGFDHIRQFNGDRMPLEDRFITCAKSSTNEATHKLVWDNRHLLPEYDGDGGKGQGPRYCPSIFKKVERFPDRKGHNCFLEPEGINTDVVYPNGMSGPYPPEIQLKILRTMEGMGGVELVIPGYDVEYDFVDPIQLTHTLETKKVSGLFLAGQICGTTGYEEAGAQGIVAGANAGKAGGMALRGEGKAKPFILGRDESYIGVLVDDLVTKGTKEPYRMFTSRSEYRLSLRADNADIRLTRRGLEYGLVRNEERVRALDCREAIVEESLERLQSFSLLVHEWSDLGGEEMGGKFAHDTVKRHGKRKSALEILKMPNVGLEDVEAVMRKCDEGHRGVPTAAFDTVEAQIKYSSYLGRQERDMASWRRSQGVKIPPDLTFDRATFPTLSAEELQKLNTFKPATFADAGNISGMTPQSLVYVYHYVMKRQKERDKNRARSEPGAGAKRIEEKRPV